MPFILDLTNIGRFDALHLELQDGEIVEIQGDNDQGKTTVLETVDSLITGVMRGKTSQRDGEREGTITGQVNDTSICRVVKDGKTKTLDVRDQYNDRQLQAFLDDNFRLEKKRGAFLNPMMLDGLNDKDLAGVVAKALDINLQFASEQMSAITGRQYAFIDNTSVFDAIKQAHTTYFNDRRDTKRDLDQMEANRRAAFDAIPKDFDPDNPPPNEPPSMNVLYEQRDQMRERNQERQQVTKKIAEGEAYIRDLEERLAKARLSLEAYQQRERELGAEDDVSAVTEKINQHEERMNEYREDLRVHGERKFRHAQAQEYLKQEQALRERWESLESKVKALNDLPGKMLATANVPIPGMFIDNECIKLPDKQTGVLKQVSDFGEGKRLDFCVRIAMALAPAPIILIDGMEKCGPKRSMELYRYIESQGFMCISTRTTAGEFRIVKIIDGEPEQVTIEEGPDWNLFAQQKTA